MRIDDVARHTGIPFRWRPFDVRALMLAMDNIPFSTKPVKARYMWRDVERRAEMYGVPWSGIPIYPLKHLTFVNRIALVGARGRLVRGLCARRLSPLVRQGLRHQP